MGIPSFYRHLCRRHGHLIRDGVVQKVAWLCLDFNCAMYDVLRSQPPFRATQKEEWEARFCRDIAAYMRKVIELADPTVGVIVSCDGAVCAAKRRQQRLRRFKGPWSAAQEARILSAAQEARVLSAAQEARVLSAAAKEAVPTEKWDQNALTPGTVFMEKLGAILTEAGREVSAVRGITVRVSTTAEPGEGEHKLLAEMRRLSQNPATKPASCAIYGLDADLILLAMLLVAETGCEVSLIREAQEFEAKVSGWRTLTINGLAAVLIPGGPDPHRIRDFVAAMSLLGNDFLPRSLTRTVRDDGILKLLGTLQSTLWEKGEHLVGEDGAVRREGLLVVLQSWAETEEADLLAAARRGKDEQTRRIFPPAGMDPRLAEWNAQPARWGTVTQILSDDERGLVDGWREWYKEHWHAGDAREYLSGVAWVWDYYSGRQVDMGWYYDGHLPPLWGDVVALLRADTTAELSAPQVRYPTPLPDWLHLLSVLPADSVRGLLPPARQRLMARAPLFWPTAWSMYDVGRTQMWECEPMIPLLPEGLLRSWI